MKNFFYNHVIYTYTALFSSIFDEMTVYTYDSNGKATGYRKVPVKLAYKEKVLASFQNKNNATPFKQKDNENTLPMISIAFKGLAFDPDRARGLRDKRKLYIEYVDDATDGLSNQVQHLDYQTVPHKLNFTVTFWAGTFDHLMQLIENIYPFIHPELYLEFYEKGLGLGKKVKVTKTGESQTLANELAENESRNKILQWDINFEMECDLYKPELPVGKPIKRIINRFYSSNQRDNQFGVEKDAVIEVQTQNADGVTAATSSMSATYCYYDLDANLVSFIRDFTDDESTLNEQLEPLVADCPSDTGELIEPPEVPFKPFAFGQQSITSSSVTITSNLLTYNYTPIAIVNVPTNSSYHTTVSSISGATDGHFTVNLIDAPPVSAGYSIIWYATRIF